METPHILPQEKFQSLTQSFNGFYYNKTVLVTGHTGFKGSWLSLWLSLLGAKVVGFSLEPPTNPCHHDLLDNHITSSVIGDVRDLQSIQTILDESEPDVIFHLAAQPIVLDSYRSPVNTWSTNVMGCVNLLEAVRIRNKPCAIVLITSDKCYRNKEWIWGYRENDELGGSDPYSASKAAVELVTRSYANSFFGQSTEIQLASARAGNVIGGGDWSPHRIVPDCARAWSSNSPAMLRNPNATRPWQHVLEPLAGYLQLGSLLSIQSDLHGQSFNFGPGLSDSKSVHELVATLSSHWCGSSFNITTDSSLPAESSILFLNCDKANYHLGIKPVLDFALTCKMTADWYANYYLSDQSPAQLSRLDIATFTHLAAARDLPWV